jgi:gamma-glutamylcyclotransferase (GGCT)/AIG2-like uncharacterized protein YtfP
MPDESPGSGSPRYVFVYGTLRRTGSNDITRLQPAPRYVARAPLAGVLFDLGPYPGMTLGGDTQVWGEVYAIAPALERVLDEIEGLGENPTDEYIKREVMVNVSGQPLRCLVYEINGRYVRNAPTLAGGDWIAARR